MKRTDTNRKRLHQIALAIGMLLFGFTGCAQIRLPAIDPTGNRIFLPGTNSTQLLTPGTVNGGLFSGGGTGLFNGGGLFNSGIGTPPPVVSGQSFDTQPVLPAFTRAQTPEACVSAPTTGTNQRRCCLIPKPKKTRGSQGEIIMLSLIHISEPTRPY